MPHLGYSKKAEEYLKTCMENQDSAGGIIECQISGLPAGIGEPVFDKLDALLAHAVLSIGAVKGFEIGDGFEAARSTGSTNNDSFCLKDGQIVKKTNSSMQEVNISVKGRHDPIIVPRAVVVVESMAALTTVDLLLRNMSASMDHLLRIYR